LCRHFACLSKGDVIAINYNKKIYELNVLETKPADAVSIIECDMNVEFEAPPGYVVRQYLFFSTYGTGNDFFYRVTNLRLNFNMFLDSRIIPYRYSTVDRYVEHFLDDGTPIFTCENGIGPCTVARYL
jgi:Ubiquitin fusion degradation protein UFD1